MPADLPTANDLVMDSGRATTEIDNAKVQFFQRQILAYWDECGRKELPWRHTRDPWKLLLTEVMLRKTTSEQVRKLYQTLSAWSPQDIIDMKQNELEEFLKPLGLSRVRAAQLKLIAAGAVSADENAFESDEFLQSFAGIGRYIANAVRCCAFNEPLPALDTNMIRVIERVFGWESKVKRAREDKKLWEFASTLVPRDLPAAYNWGVLDLGAAICTAQRPKCEICPLNSICLYFQRQKISNQGDPLERESSGE